MAHPATATSLADSRPITSGPPLYHFLGFGLYLYGERDVEEESGSFVRTLCFCLFYIPVIALRSYRVAPADEGWAYLDRVPVARPARVLSLIAAITIPGACLALGALAYRNSPGYVAMRELAEADRLASEGRIGDAAGLLSHVVMGPTDRSGPAAGRLEKLLAEPASKRDPEGRAAAFRAAVEAQKAGRWPRSPQSLHDHGVALARDTAANDPLGAWAILDAVAPLAAQDEAEAAFRLELLEKVVAADPSNVERASRLAGEYAARGDMERAERVLSPLRERLGDLEGARVLGLCDARANRLELAIPLLRAYTKGRLGQIAAAEEALRSLYKSGQERIIGQLERSRVADFHYDRYRDATPADRQHILREYIEGKLKADPEVARAQNAMISMAGVIPTALELGMLLLQHAQAQADPQARKASLDEAEATFLAISRMAGDRAEYQLSLAQVYYWQGKHDLGRKLFDEVLAANKRDPALLLEVASQLRKVGSHSEARALAEEGYHKAVGPPIKDGCAALRGTMGEDAEDRILWLRRADQNDPNIKALLCGDLSDQAMERGDEGQAIAILRQAVSLYEQMPESPATLNNGSIALMRLAELTGDPAAYDRAGSMIEKAAALDPGNSLTMANASRTLLEAGLREVIGPAIDLRLIKLPADVGLIGFLAGDEAGRRAFVARLRSQATVNRALSLMEKVVLLAPRDPDSYRAPARVLAFRDDVERLRAILRRLDAAELDLSDQAKEARETYSGARDEEVRKAAKALLARLEPIVPVARAKGGPTFAVACSQLVSSRMVIARLGGEANPGELVDLAGDAYSVAPSLASRWGLVQALMFRGSERLARADPGFASMRNRFIRTLTPPDLVAMILSSDDPLKARILDDADVKRAISLIRESFVASPSFTAGPQSWSILHAGDRDVAASMAKSFLENESDRVKEEILARLEPYDPKEVLKQYWVARMEGKDDEAGRILAESQRSGIPIPIADH